MATSYWGLMARHLIIVCRLRRKVRIPSLSYFQPIRIQGVPDDIVLKRAFPRARTFRSLTITLFTSLVRLNQFSAFSTTSPSACLRINSQFVSLSCLSGWRFFPPPLLKRYLVYYILADLENKVRHLWWPNFLQPNPTLCLPSQQTSSLPRRALGHAKFPASLS